jgi:hypothetical protein
MDQLDLKNNIRPHKKISRGTKKNQKKIPIFFKSGKYTLKLLNFQNQKISKKLKLMEGRGYPSMSNSCWG